MADALRVLLDDRASVGVGAGMVTGIALGETFEGDVLAESQIMASDRQFMSHPFPHSVAQLPEE